MYPDVVHWGFLHIRSYGLMLATAFLVGTWLGLKEARRLGLDPDHLVTVVLVTLISSVLGARALYVIEHIGEFRSQWSSVLAVWQGGLTLYGGVVAGTVGGLVTARRLGMPMWSVADALAPATALGTMFGRIGCFLNGCCYGRPTSMPWGVVYPPDSFPGLEFGNTPIHPAQLYNALFGLALFAVLWSARTRVRVPGTLFWSFVIAFSLGRIVLDFFRAYEPAARVLSFGALPITESQLVSVALALFGVLMLARLQREAGPPRAAAPASVPPAVTPAPPVSGTP
jgi:phosphatidylglycerol:prolipoprotein diacylglycerol transferase